MTLLDSANYLSFKICPLLRKKEKVGQSGTMKKIIKNKINTVIRKHRKAVRPTRQDGKTTEANCSEASSNP